MLGYHRQEHRLDGSILDAPITSNNQVKTVATLRWNKWQLYMEYAA